MFKRNVSEVENQAIDLSNRLKLIIIHLFITAYHHFKTATISEVLSAEHKGNKLCFFPRPITTYYLSFNKVRSALFVFLIASKNESTYLKR